MRSLKPLSSSDKPLWVLKISRKLRLIVNFEDESIIVEDIVPVERLDASLRVGRK
ncbi:hypothetical protein [Acetobacter senegalensis]|uniref:hypothetical protein n=1 Tax=Acetobacter senegalensis TaxID=446692 RepID=UPI001592B018|nr:hypothetical protein [Acetobacter senegalensis]